MSKLDEVLYSRQIATLGKDTCESLSNGKVTIYGFNLQLVKNLILLGVNHININCNKIIELTDLCSNIFLNEDDLGKEFSIIKERLCELNPYITLEFNNSDIIYNVYVLVNNNLDVAYEINNLARSNNSAFIWLNSYNLFGNVFSDFNNFTSYDDNGENLDILLINSITDEGVFITVENDKHSFSEGDSFILEDIKGINGINNSVLRVDKVIDRNTFEVISVFDWSKYISGGRIIPIKNSINFEHQDLNESFKNPSFVNFNDVTEHHNLFRKYHGENCESKLDNFLNNFESEFILVNSIVGSIAAQEVIKFISKKYTPLSQWYYYDCFDILPDEYDKTITIKNDRYDNIRTIFGDELFEKIFNSSVFVVGAGAIGCQHLINMTGVGIREIYITDMDNIEKSNLNRQDLFRNSDIGNSKSVVASEKIMKMNKYCRIIPQENKVCKDTSELYNSKFFENIKLVAGALDNIEARYYLDELCILNQKPYFDSGTLGTQGNTQSVIPRISEPYGKSRDPPEKHIPVCTLKNFPSKIEHVIQWARDEFEELFNSYPNSWIKYVNDPLCLKQMNGNQKGEIINNILYLWNNKPSTFEDCIIFSLNRFYEKYNHIIRQLLHSFPKDHLTSNGHLYWSGNKRCPTELDFDPNNEIMNGYVLNLSILFAEMFNIDVNLEIFDSITTNYKKKDFKLKDEKISDNDKEEQNKKKEQLEKCQNLELPQIEDMKIFNVKQINFEKDDDTNNHINFINYATNLRALNYDIPLIDKLETKIIAGKIIPAISTTTTIISALSIVEMIKYIFGKSKLSDYKDTYLNLAINMYSQSEPKPCHFEEINNMKISVWDHYKNINQDVYIKDLINELNKFYNVNIDTLIYGTKMILSSINTSKFNLRLECKISEIFNEMKIDYKDKEIEIAIDDSSKDLEFPNIKIIL